MRRLPVIRMKAVKSLEYLRKSESEPMFNKPENEELINWYEQSKYGNSLKDQFIKNYGHDDVETSLGKKLKSLNSAGNAVLWFKGDPSESGAINSLQTAKTEHWLSAGAGNTIISKIAKGSKYAIAGSLADGMKVALAGNLTSDNQFTVDKLNEAGYTN